MTTSDTQMTINNSRHTACKYCRDRKVRCDGEQPACEKCRRAGEECIYLPTQRPTRADLTHTVESLQKRLYEAEARISRMAPQPSKPTVIAQPQPQQAFYSATWPTTTEFSAPSAFHCPLPPFTSSASATAEADPPSSQGSGYPVMFYQSTHKPNSPGGLNSDFLDSLQSTSPRTIVGRNDSINFRGDDDDEDIIDTSDTVMSEKMGFPSFPGDGHNHLSQGYVDVNLMSSSGSSVTGSSSSAPLQDGSRSSRQSEDHSAAIATHLATFSSAVFHTQAEIAGIAFAVAEYISWMRKVPAGIAPPNTSLVYVNVLETIESRLREMREMAQTGPQAAFREMVTSLEALGPAGSSACNSLSGLEEEFQKKSADVAKFFQTRYNACALLSEQAQNVPHGPGAKKGSSPQSTNSQ